MPVAHKQEPRLTPLEVSAKFVRQRRQDRHVAIGPPFSMGDVDLRWIAIQKQILYANVHEFIHPCTGLEQRLNHQTVFALAAVGSLNQAFDFALLQPGYRSVLPARRLKRQPAPDPFHDVFGLVVAEMMLAPEAEGLFGLFIVMENFLALRVIAHLAGVNCGSRCRRRVPSMMCNRFSLPHLDSPPRGRYSTVLRFVASGAD